MAQGYCAAELEIVCDLGDVEEHVFQVSSDCDFFDGEGQLAGVITDGDLRRLHLRGDGSIDDLTAGQVASREPKMICADALAAKALEVMETWQITSLVIVDQARRPVGIIHLHDILRAKIV